MEFKEAFNWAKQGKRITLPSFKGYWYWDAEAKSLMIVTKEGETLDIRESPDMDFTLGFMFSDQWSFFEGEFTPEYEITFDFSDVPTGPIRDHLQQWHDLATGQSETGGGEKYYLWDKIKASGDTLQDSTVPVNARLIAIDPHWDPNDHCGGQWVKVNESVTGVPDTVSFNTFEEARRIRDYVFEQMDVLQDMDIHGVHQIEIVVRFADIVRSEVQGLLERKEIDYSVDKLNILKARIVKNILSTSEQNRAMYQTVDVTARKFFEQTASHSLITIVADYLNNPN